MRRGGHVTAAMLVVGIALCVACGRGGEASPPVPGDQIPAGPAPTAPTTSPAPTTSSAPPPPGDGGEPGKPVDGGVDAPPPPPGTSSDGIKNGGETDIDCGGPDAARPRCTGHAACLAASDCASQLCGAKGPAAGRCLLAPSCTGAPGTFTCGPAGDQDCCGSLPVPGGSYLRLNDAKFPATVGKFSLDAYEITVGRLRAYFEAMGGNPKAHAPAPGAGAHPKVASSGWRASFDVRLASSWQEIDGRLGPAGCALGGDNTDGGAATWTSTAGPYEALPITCLDWYTMFAFCAWDGGRLPSDAEWGFAAEGGNEQRWYAWGGPQGPLAWPDQHAVLLLTDPVDSNLKYTWGTPFRATDPATGKVNDGPAHIAPPGRMPTGNGRWGHADLTGNLLEYLLDRTPIPEGACTDCARVDWADPPQDQVGWYPPAWSTVALPTVDEDYPDGTRSLRGGSWDVHVPVTWYRYEYRVQRTYYAAGARCARD